MSNAGAWTERPLPFFGGFSLMPCIVCSTLAVMDTVLPVTSRPTQGKYLTAPSTGHDGDENGSK
jgi:hypothetical protein